MSETALEIVQPRSVVTRDAIAAATEQRKLVAEFVHANMKEGHDFGVIPGTPKPSLWKPGAEKLVELFRCTPHFTLVKTVEDFDRSPPLFSYVFSVTLEQRDSGAVVAEGYGSCNSLEDRYRWRRQNPQCPTCSAESLFRSKKKGEGYFCWSKKGGCGATFKEDDKAATEAFSSAGRVANEDTASLANTILKMATKRALVAAALMLARISDMFTQDVEDMQQKKPRPIWEQVAEAARGYGFQCGEKNALLWAFAAKVLDNKPAAKWTADDYDKLDVALAESVKPEADVAF